jgi:hypothetical protein
MARKELRGAKKISCVILSDRLYKSVARIRLVKTEKPSVCVTVNYEVCRSAIVPNLPVVPIQNPSYKSRAKTLKT